jgi:cytochrome c-type biogenesis protein
LVLAVAVVGLTGYAGYELYPRFDLPALEGAGLLVLAAGAGIASFFAPCSFPLLMTLLTRQVGRSANDDGRPAVFAAALAGGATLFLMLFGALIALGGSALAAGVTFTSTIGITLRAVVGATLVLLGLVQRGLMTDSPFRSVERVTKRLNRSQARLRRRHPIAGFTAFGFFYLLAGFG